jgi:hypothetical protein
MRKELVRAVRYAKVGTKSDIRKIVKIIKLIRFAVKKG